MQVKLKSIPVVARSDDGVNTNSAGIKTILQLCKKITTVYIEFE